MEANNSLSRSKDKNSSNGVILDNGRIVDNIQDMSNEINNYFVNIEVNSPSKHIASSNYSSSWNSKNTFLADIQKVHTQYTHTKYTAKKRRGKSKSISHAWREVYSWAGSISC